ncbi:hypothetical protein ONZ43_g3105 [Nemania bipapillata]|uniref:Uncharacterized protein n=1 Tax=Nemania bipapillata TaxID=110536 RepID=A0ACC2IXZ4_9PEZI|nr:hypothetical protein ONZ43_g3105 [Nemania bipapillata]
MALLNAYFGSLDAADPGQYISVGTYTAYPYSKGHLHITGPEVSDPLDFNVGFFSDPGDVDIKILMWAYKKGREIARRTSMYRGELQSGHPPFPAESDTACITFDAARDTANLKDLVYSPEDDKILEQFWAREELGVVDKDLNVYGVKGLKLADLSIVSENVAANTNNTAIVIGEKAADIIIGELGLKLPN